MSCDTSVDHARALGEPPVAEVATVRRLFPGQASQLPLMRDWLRSLLRSGSVRDDILSIATELAANAIRHTASGNGGKFAVELACRSASVLLAVTDEGGAAAPELGHYPDAENGRGLLLVHGLSARVGVAGDDHGRTVWAELREADEQLQRRVAAGPMRIAFDVETAGRCEWDGCQRS
jgi:anti-sigma regulatory factor (Ser/Thr protein kinase)